MNDERMKKIEDYAKYRKDYSEPARMILELVQYINQLKEDRDGCKKQARERLGKQTS